MQINEPQVKNMGCENINKEKEKEKEKVALSTMIELKMTVILTISTLFFSQLIKRSAQ